MKSMVLFPRMIGIRWIWRVALGSSLFSPLNVSADSINCPRQVVVESLVVRDVPSGWQSTVGSPSMSLASVGLFDGPPNQNASLRPSATTKQSEDTSRVQWHFEGEFPRGKWLACAYGGQVVLLARELPSGTRQCTVTYTGKRKDASRVSSIECN